MEVETTGEDQAGGTLPADREKSMIGGLRERLIAALASEQVEGPSKIHALLGITPCAPATQQCDPDAPTISVIEKAIQTVIPMRDEQCDQTAASARSIEVGLRDIVSDRKITNEHTTHVRSVSKYRNFDSLINISYKEKSQGINDEIASMRTGAASPITLLGVYA